MLQNTIPGGVWKAMLRNIGMLRYNSRWGRSVAEGRPTKCHNFRNGESVYNGFGIVTTGLHPTDLSRDEERLYNLIVRRVIDAFAPDSAVNGRSSQSAFDNRRKNHKGRKKNRRYRKVNKAKNG